MKKFSRLLLCIVCALAIGAAFAACGPTAAEVTGVALDKTALTLTVGGTETLKATVEPAEVEDKSVEWSSSDTAVVTVGAGMVTAVKAGSATITVKTKSGGKIATCAVTVVQAKLTEEQWKKAVEDTLSAGNLTVKVVQARGEERYETEAKYDKEGGKIWSKGELGASWSERYIVKGETEVCDYTKDVESGKWNLSTGDIDGFDGNIESWEGIGDGVRQMTVDLIPLAEYKDITFESGVYSFCVTVDGADGITPCYKVTVDSGYLTQIDISIKMDAEEGEEPSTIAANFTLFDFGTTSITLPTDLPQT